MKPYFVAFCGASGSGKTTLIEKLIPVLTQMGHRAAALKHTTHTGHTLGDEGKDSDRLFKAGAQTSVFWCPEQIMVKKRPNTHLSVEEEVKTYFQDADIVLVEGLQNSSWPEDKILVIQKASPQMCGFSLPLKERVMAIISSPPHLSSLQFSGKTHATAAAVGYADSNVSKTKKLYTDRGEGRSHIPHFAPEDVEQIAEFIVRKLYALC